MIIFQSIFNHFLRINGFVYYQELRGRGHRDSAGHEVGQEREDGVHHVRQQERGKLFNVCKVSYF